MKKKILWLCTAAAACGTFLMSAAAAPAGDDSLVDEISAAPSITGYSTILTSNKASLTLEKVKTFCSIDSGDLELVVESDTLTGNADKAGDYQIIFSATDEDGNKETFPVKCSIVENISNVYYVESKYVFTPHDVALTLAKTDLIGLLVASGQVDATKQYSAKVTDTDGLFAVLEAENVEFADKDYDVTIDVEYADGNTASFAQTVKVYDEDSYDFQTKEDNWFVKGIKWFHNNILKPIGRLIWAAVDYTLGTLVRCVRWIFTGVWTDYYDHTIIK